MRGAQSISTRRAYGVQRVCRVWHRARSSVYARRQATRSPARCRRRGPIGAAPDDVLVAHLRRVLEASPFHGEGDRKAWAKLRVAGMRTSKERVRRLMREHDLQAPPRATGSDSAAVAPHNRAVLMSFPLIRLRYGDTLLCYIPIAREFPWERRRNCFGPGDLRPFACRRNSA